MGEDEGSDARAVDGRVVDESRSAEGRHQLLADDQSAPLRESIRSVLDKGEKGWTYVEGLESNAFEYRGSLFDEDGMHDLYTQSVPLSVTMYEYLLEQIPRES